VNEFDNINDAMNTIIAVYRRKRWSDQENYVEVWVEKDALSGVLQPITQDYTFISSLIEDTPRFRPCTIHPFVSEWKARTERVVFSSISEITIRAERTW
jgi:hypothetical protein